MLFYLLEFADQYLNIGLSFLNSMELLALGLNMERHPDGFGGADLPFALLSSHPGGGGGTAG
jgi:hypothetical protein